VKAIYIDPYVVSVCLGDVLRVVNDEIEVVKKESKERFHPDTVFYLEDVAKFIRVIKRKYEEKYLGGRVDEGVATYLEGIAQEIRPRMR